MKSIESEAEARHLRHQGHPTHRPLSNNYELVGLRGEEALANMFGAMVDLVPRPNGDGGRDIILKCKDKSGAVCPFNVDVKTARKPYHLIVEQGKVKPLTIYVLARYYDDGDCAVLLGWAWGSSLLSTEPRDFGHGVLNHAIRAWDLRPMSELQARAAA